MCAQHLFSLVGARVDLHKDHQGSVSESFTSQVCDIPRKVFIPKAYVFVKFVHLR